MKSVFIIAEIGQAHDGSLGILHSYIDAAAECGVNAVKFQTHIANAESSPEEPFRIPFSYEDRTRMDYWRRMELSKDQWVEVKKHCDEKNIEFMSSPFSMEAVELLESLDMQKWKIPSGEVSNHLMLEYISELKKPVLLSSGMSDFKEIEDAVGRIEKHHKEIALMQCTSEYPSRAQSIGINVLQELKEKFQYEVGLSDHSGRIEPALMAATLGAKYIEAHIVFDKRMFGPDSKASLEVNEFKSLVESIRFVEDVLNNPVDKNNVARFDNMKTTFGKSLAFRLPLKKGEKIQRHHLETKKPGNLGVPAKDYESVLEKRLSRDVLENEFIKEDSYE